MPKHSSKRTIQPHSFTGRASQIDIFVGQRIRLRRQLLKITQQELADSIGVSFQQIQKYENASNSLSSTRLWNISQALHAPLSFFFEDVKARQSLTNPNYIDPLKRTETLELVKNYYKITNRLVAKQIFNLLDEVANPISENKTLITR
ncbi:MAG: helix-turn-helix transcriptional regulator [Alphaproteobacteria bacterium]|nr:helix-turn-helix transcriptional regulator [Alphaproteobacteria bacterium]